MLPAQTVPTLHPSPSSRPVALSERKGLLSISTRKLGGRAAFIPSLTIRATLQTQRSMFLLARLSIEAARTVSTMLSRSVAASLRRSIVSTGKLSSYGNSTKNSRHTRQRMISDRLAREEGIRITQFSLHNIRFYCINLIQPFTINPPTLYTNPPGPANCKSFRSHAPFLKQKMTGPTCATKAGSRFSTNSATTSARHLEIVDYHCYHYFG